MVRGLVQSISSRCGDKCGGHHVAALASFAYNVGLGALYKSTLWAHVQSGRYHEATTEFKRWVKANGKTVRGLVKRREEERAVFQCGTAQEETELTREN